MIAGSGQLYKNDQGIISFWINSWKKNKKLNYLGFDGKGNQTRDCLHPSDLGNLIITSNGVVPPNFSSISFIPL